MTGTAVDLIWLAPALALLGFVLNGALALWRPTAKTAVTVIGVGVLAGAFAVGVAVVAAFAGLHAEAPVVFRYWSWMSVGTLQVDAALQVDQLSAVMLLVVTGVGSLIHLFSVGYMKEDAGYARYFAYLNLFIFFMLVLVLGANFPVMFVGWEGVGLCSYLLIGFWFNEKVNADAGKKAFIVNRIGDFGFLVAMFIIFWATGSLDFQEVFAKAPTLLAVGGGAVTATTLFLFLGCTGKSAQIPLYTWLPDAMQGPPPVSALIHAATMVTAGVYLVARCNVLFALAPISGAVVAGTGALTALFAATIALKQWDIKRVLAYSTISQLGYMFVGVGTGAMAAGVFHLVTHAFFKALLFLGSGSVIYAMHHAYHATHSQEDAQDMRNMGGLRHHLPWTAGLMWIALRVLFEGRDSGRGIRPRHGAARVVGVLGPRAGRRAAHRVLHDAADALHLPRAEPHRLGRAGASARGALGDDGPPGNPGSALGGGGPAQHPRAMGRQRPAAPVARARDQGGSGPAPRGAALAPRGVDPRRNRGRGRGDGHRGGVAPAQARGARPRPRGAAGAGSGEGAAEQVVRG